MKINKISSYRSLNYFINLQPSAISSMKKIYEIFKNQTTIIKKYVNKILKKNYIAIRSVNINNEKIK